MTKRFLAAPVLAVALAASVAAPVAAQDWERVFGTASGVDPDFQVLALDPAADRSSRERYKLVPLADLLAPIYTFPDTATRYVAVKAGGGSRPTFTAPDLAAGATSPGLLSAVAIPRPSTPGVWIAIATPTDRPLTYAAIGGADYRIDRTGSFVPQAGAITIGEAGYRVWTSNETIAFGVDRRYMFFARGASLPPAR